MVRFQVCLAIAWAGLLVSTSGEQDIGTPNECKDAPFVPGYNLAGEGFDVVTMERKSTYVVNTENWDKGNGTCMIKGNDYMNGQRQKLPAAVVFWRALPKCSMTLSSKILESSEALVEESSSSLSVGWKVGLNIKLVGAAVGSTHSREAKFAMGKSKTDKYTFTKHQVDCDFYRYGIAEKPPLHPEFLSAIKSLPKSYDPTAYRNLIITYGTHYTTQVWLGGQMKAITAIKTCQAAMNGLTESAVKDCLDVEASGSYSIATVKVETKLCKEKKKKMGTNEKFSSMFDERQLDIIGGKTQGVDLLFSGSSHPKVLQDWIESLKSIPDVIRYSLKPLYFLLSPNDPVREGLKRETERYIIENALVNICSKPCSSGSKSSARDKCACVCQSSKIITSNCCPTAAGLATLEVYKLSAQGLYGDTFSQTDAIASVTYGKQMWTEKINNNDNPNWRERFYFGPIKISTVKSLIFEVYDVDSWKKELLGTCSFELRSGIVSDACMFQHGTFFFTYKVKCAPNLQGQRCEKHKPSPMEANLAHIFSSRNGVLVKDIPRLELALNRSYEVKSRSAYEKLMLL